MASFVLVIGKLVILGRVRVRVRGTTSRLFVNKITIYYQPVCYVLSERC